MNTIRGTFVVMALAAWPNPAVAQTVQEATTPTSTVEAGAGPVSDGSFKAGEFNGLQKKGLFAIGNVDWRGGARYDSDSPLRWRVRGTDLGLDTRSLTAESGVQGKYRITFGYDELRRNRSDSYQTPYDGAGSDTLTLPGSWLVPTIAGSTGSNNRANAVSARGLTKSIGGASYIDTQTTSATVGALLTPSAAQLALMNAAADADLPLFHNVDLHTKRRRYDGGLNYHFTPELGFDLSFRGEHKGGMKPMGTVSRNANGDISTIIPDLIDSDTEQLNSSLSFKGDKSFAQAAYYGSFFTNHVASMTWQNWSTGPGPTATRNTLSSAPDNIFHQFNLAARYNLSSATRLVANGSYGRATQNVAFLSLPTVPVMPVASLDGLVVSTALNAKLTSKVGKKLNLTAGYTFDDRDNRTPIHIFQYADAEEAAVASASFPAGSANPLGAVLAQNANANRAYSRKQHQASADADFALGKGQFIKGGYEFERTNRWCNGSWVSCADAAVTNENMLRAEWRANLSENVNARIDYAFSARRTPYYNENAFLAIVPYANVSPAAATNGATALSFMLANGWNGWGPALPWAATTGNMNLFFPSNNALANAMYANGNRISELPGMRRYFVADRDRNKLRSSLNWQATAALSLQGGLDFTGDHYTDSTYGLQDSRMWAVNLDGSYALSERVSTNVFYTFEDHRFVSAGNTYTANSNVASVNGLTGLSGNSCDSFTTLQQRNNNNKLDPCLDWSANMLDKVNTVGVALTGKTDKVDLTGNLVFGRGRSGNDPSGGNWANNPLALPGAQASTSAAYFLAAAALPPVTTDTVELRVNGTYAAAPHQSLRVLYSYLHMRSADWGYDGMQIGAGTMSGVLPTNEQPFNYGVHILGLSWVVSF